MPEALPGPVPLEAAPKDTSPSKANVAVAPTLAVLIMIATRISATTLGNFEKRFATHRYWRIRSMLKGHTVRSRWTWERGDLGLCLYWGTRLGCLGFCRFTIN